MKKTSIICIFTIFLGLNLHAQIGINTENPQAVLDIKSNTTTSTDKVLHVADVNNTEILQVRNDGYIGIGVTNPLVKLDLRGNDGAIGIGYTNMVAASAGAGAIRYNSTPQALEYSDGEEWIRLQKKPQKAFVLANNSFGQVFIESTPTVYASRIFHWTTLQDQTNNFDATGCFYGTSYRIV